MVSPIFRSVCNIARICIILALCVIIYLYEWFSQLLFTIPTRLINKKVLIIGFPKVLKLIWKWVWTNILFCASNLFGEIRNDSVFRIFFNFASKTDRNRVAAARVMLLEYRIENMETGKESRSPSRGASFLSKRLVHIVHVDMTFRDK